MPPEKIELEITRLSDKLSRHPDSRIFAPLADAYRQAGRIAEAIEVCQQGLRYHPEYVAGQIVLAKCYFDRGELEAATSVFGQVVRSDARNLTALRGLGEIAYARGDVENARSWYVKALEVDPENAELRERAAAVDRGVPAGTGFGSQQPFTTAAPAGTEGDGGAVGEEIATVTLAEIYAEQGLNDRALAIYRRILLDDPENALIRDKAERLERLLQERARVDVGVASRAGGSLPGEMRLTGDEVVTSATAEDEGAAADAGGLFDEQVAGRSAAAASRGTSEPWAFLMVDETDHDPDEIFGGSAARQGGTGSLGGAGSAWGTPAEAAFVAQASASDAGAQGEEEDLRKFQDWLKSLG